MIHREFLKRIIPGRFRPTILTVLKVSDSLIGLPTQIRLRLLGRNRLRAFNIARRDKRVIFIAERPSWREAKLARGLKVLGWDVVLLCRKDPVFGDTGDFAEVQSFNSPASAVALGYKSKARLLHTFAPICDDTCVQLVKDKPGRVIVDFYDDFFSITDGFPDMQRKYAVDIANQGFCLDRADAICARDMQLQYRRKATGVGRGRPILSFPEYCWDRQPLPGPRSDGEVRVAQIGYMGFEVRGEQDVGCFRVIREFVDAGCHFHIYMHPTFPPIGTQTFNYLFSQYLELSQTTGRLHFHPTVPSNELVQELTKYDFGFNMINGPTFRDIEWTRMNPKRLPYCGSSRLFDYLDAGLGMVVDGELSYMRRTFGPFGIILNGTELVNARRIRGALSNRPSRDVFLKARQKLSIEHNVHRLASFYERLS